MDCCVANQTNTEIHTDTDTLLGSIVVAVAVVIPNDTNRDINEDENDLILHSSQSVTSGPSTRDSHATKDQGCSESPSGVGTKLSNQNGGTNGRDCR